MNHKNEFDSFSLINYIWKYRKMFLIVCGLAGILGIFFSSKLFIHPRFTSTTIIYAPRTNSFSKIFTNENNINERLDIKAYAIQEETEQMMQILESREIKDMLIERYDLENYYGIPSYRKAGKAKLYKAVDGAVKIKRTRYGAISISVEDWSPERAAQMANDIASELDTIKNRIEHARAIAAVHALENKIFFAEEQRRILEDSLEVLAQHGVFFYDTQSERVIQQYAIALAQGNMAGVQRLQKEIEKLEKWGHAANSLRREQLYLSDKIAFMRVSLLNAQMDATETLPVKFVLEKAIPTDKKSYPKILIIAILSSLGTFFVLLISMLSIDKIKEEIMVNSKENMTSKQE